MDILYVVGTGSLWNNNELRYSLRSIAKNGGNVGRVFIVGYKPNFVSDLVTYIPCDDPYDRAHKNILHKVLTAVESGLLPEHFLISSDDHFYIKQTNFDTLPVYYRQREIPADVPWNKHYTPYFVSLAETRAMMERHGLPLYQTNPHCNTHFDVATYRANKHIFDECFQLRNGGEMNCVMGNLLIQAGATPEHFHDSKLENTIRDAASFAARIGDTNCISGVPRMAASYVANWLIRNFPDKSIYEK